MACGGDDPQDDPGGGAADAAPTNPGDAAVDARQSPHDDAAHVDPDAAADVATTTFCTGRSEAFCADFDRSDDVASGFATSELTGGCTAAVEHSDPKSPTGAGRFACAAPDGGGGKATVFASIQAGGKTHLHVEVDFKISEHTFEVHEGAGFFYLTPTRTTRSR